VQYFNRSYRRSGTLWEGRFRSCPTDAENYLLACQRYIEFNPVRAGMVSHPAECRWSSYRANALYEPDPLVTPLALYTSLGRTAPDRANAYRELFRYELDPGRPDRRDAQRHERKFRLRQQPLRGRDRRCAGRACAAR